MPDAALSPCLSPGRALHRGRLIDRSPPDANPYLVMLGIFKSGLEGDTAQVENLRTAERYLPDNIYDALQNFRNAEWTGELLGEDVKGRFADLKQASADRCPRLLGTFVKAPEVQYHHEVYNQYLWNMF